VSDKVVSTCTSVCPSLLFHSTCITQQNEYNFALDFLTKLPYETHLEYITLPLFYHNRLGQDHFNHNWIIFAYTYFLSYWDPLVFQYSAQFKSAKNKSVHISSRTNLYGTYLYYFSASTMQQSNITLITFYWNYSCNKHMKA
jgi:hypothetical protein